MATPAIDKLQLDPHKQARYSLTLSERLTSPGSAPKTKGYSAVKYNHKIPARSGSTRKTTIQAAGGNGYDLSIRDSGEGGGKYQYSGSKSTTKRNYVLVFDTASQTCRLEPLDDTYNFNLTSTPTVSDSHKLAEKYPQLRTTTTEDEEGEVAGEDNLFGNEEDSDPDPDNPYDFRNYLDKTPSASATQTSESSDSIPLAKISSSTVAVKSAPKSSAASASTKPRPAPKSAAALKKRKDPPPPVVVAAKKDKPPVPTVRLDRKASVKPTEKQEPKPKEKPAKPSKPAPEPVAVTPTSPTFSASKSFPSSEDEAEDDNTGGLGLTIDYGGSTPPRFKKKNPFAISSSGNGPISLRSAASSASPASRLHTPLVDRYNASGASGTGGNGYGIVPVRKRLENVEIDFSFDDSDNEADNDDQITSAPMNTNHQAQAQAEEPEEDAEADGDVDELDLGSPVQAEDTRRGSEKERVEVSAGREQHFEPDEVEEDAGDDVEFDFVAEMEKELADDASEESEEE